LPRYKNLEILVGGFVTGCSRIELIIFSMHGGISNLADVDVVNKRIIAIRAKQIMGTFMLSFVIKM
jgi:hypothetical protein